MEIGLVKLDKQAVIPSKAHLSDAGYDLTAVEKYNDEYGNIVYDTKIAISIPEGFAGLLFPRSSISKIALTLSNSVGVIDSGYRGPILLKFKPTPYFTTRNEGEVFEYEVGDRVGQLVIVAVEQIQFKVVEQLTDSTRGIGGYGSSGN
jgi:dUTP pyrophosphatase